MTILFKLEAHIKEIKTAMGVTSTKCQTKDNQSCASNLAISSAGICVKVIFHM